MNPLPIPKLNVKVMYRKAIKVLEIRKADFVICHPREIRKRKRLIGEEIWVVHLKSTDKWNIRKLK